MTNPALADVSPASPNTDAHDAFEVTVTLQDGYAFTVDPGIDGAAGFLIDETPPLGEGRGPNPARVLASAMASCLGASLLFCLRKARVEPSGLRVIARGHMVRDARKRLRIGGVSVRLEPGFAAGTDLSRMERCQQVFQDFCTVTESVRRGVPVEVEVVPSTASA